MRSSDLFQVLPKMWKCLQKFHANSFKSSHLTTRTLFFFFYFPFLFYDHNINSNHIKVRLGISCEYVSVWGNSTFRYFHIYEIAHFMFSIILHSIREALRDWDIDTHDINLISILHSSSLVHEGIHILKCYGERKRGWVLIIITLHHPRILWKFHSELCTQFAT